MAKREIQNKCYIITKIFLIISSEFSVIYSRICDNYFSSIIFSIWYKFGLYLQLLRDDITYLNKDEIKNS